MEIVAVLGASSDFSRYSYQAIKLLQEFGHRPIPVHPREKEILGIPVTPFISELVKSQVKVDTLTMYVNPALSSNYIKDIIALKPGRVIFNPGSENPELQKALAENGIEYEEACTLVLLRTGQY